MSRTQFQRSIVRDVSGLNIFISSHGSIDSRTESSVRDAAPFLRERMQPLQYPLAYTVPAGVVFHFHSEPGVAVANIARRVADAAEAIICYNILTNNHRANDICFSVGPGSQVPNYRITPEYDNREFMSKVSACIPRGNVNLSSSSLIKEQGNTIGELRPLQNIRYSTNLYSLLPFGDPNNLTHKIKNLRNSIYGNSALIHIHCTFCQNVFKYWGVPVIYRGLNATTYINLDPLPGDPSPQKQRWILVEPGTLTSIGTPDEKKHGVLESQITWPVPDWFIRVRNNAMAADRQAPNQARIHNALQAFRSPTRPPHLTARHVNIFGNLQTRPEDDAGDQFGSLTVGDNNITPHRELSRTTNMAITPQSTNPFQYTEQERRRQTQSEQRRQREQREYLRQIEIQNSNQMNVDDDDREDDSGDERRPQVSPSTARQFPYAIQMNVDDDDSSGDERLPLPQNIVRLPLPQNIQPQTSALSHAFVPRNRNEIIDRAAMRSSPYRWSRRRRRRRK